MRNRVNPEVAKKLRERVVAHPPLGRGQEKQLVRPCILGRGQNLGDPTVQQHGRRFSLGIHGVTTLQWPCHREPPHSTVKILSDVLGFVGVAGTLVTLGSVVADPNLLGELYTAYPLLFALTAIGLVLVAGFWVRDRLWPLAATGLKTTRQFVVYWWESRPIAERRAYPVRAFIHLPEGQEPDDPTFRCRPGGVEVLRPWRARPLVGNENNAWACSAFAYPEGDGKRYAVTKSVKGGGSGAFGVQFSADGESWHIGIANSDDRYSRHRYGAGHLTRVLPLDPKRVRTPGTWFELFTVPVRGESAYDTRPVEPFRLESIQELRAELTKVDNGEPNSGRRLASDILYSPSDLRLTTMRSHEQFDELAPMSYLRFATPVEGGWSLSVGSARPKDLRSINDTGIDMILLEDDPGIVHGVAYQSYGFRTSVLYASLKLHWR